MTINIVRTSDNLINVSAGYGVSITASAAHDLARRLGELAHQIEQDAARAVCAVEGHQWYGYNAYRAGDLDDKIYLRYCEREHCETREEHDGWRDVVEPGRPA